MENFRGRNLIVTLNFADSQFSYRATRENFLHEIWACHIHDPPMTDLSISEKINGHFLSIHESFLPPLYCMTDCECIYHAIDYSITFNISSYIHNNKTKLLQSDSTNIMFKKINNNIDWFFDNANILN